MKIIIQQKNILMTNTYSIFLWFFSNVKYILKKIQKRGEHPLHAKTPPL